MLTVFSDYVCPFSYLAETVIERARRAEGGSVAYGAYELWPHGTSPPGTDDAALWQGTILPVARALGVDIRRPDDVPRTRKAHEAAQHARDASHFERMRAALFRAHFVEGRDIGRIDALVEIGRECGLDGLALKIALDIDAAAPAIEADRREATSRGVTGTPAFVTASEVVHGLQPEGVLRALLRRADADQSK